MVRYIIAYAATAVVFFGLDFVWLGTVANGFYKARIGSLLLNPPNFVAAAAFYAVYVVGIVMFGEVRGFEGAGWRGALLWGALFGFFAYATYDMTNYAVLKGYSAAVAAADLAWGTVLTGVSSLAGYAVAVWITR